MSAAPAKRPRRRFAALAPPPILFALGLLAASLVQACEPRQAIATDCLWLPTPPNWVACNIQSIVCEEDDRLVQIGPDFYFEGEHVRECSNVVVDTIEPDRIIVTLGVRVGDSFFPKRYALQVMEK